MPRVYDSLSTDRVLTMEWIDGCKVRSRLPVRTFTEPDNGHGVDSADGISRE